MYFVSVNSNLDCKVNFSFFVSKIIFKIFFMLHQSGFVNIIGKPNAGKSTLMNALVGERLSIISHKAQTTRHRIRGIVSGENFQIVYSDTPGIIKPAYLLQDKMMKFIETAFTDADIILFVKDITDKKNDDEILERLKKCTVPVILIVNKIDLATQDEVMACIENYKSMLPFAAIQAVSATEKFNTDGLLGILLEYLPESPPYFPKDEMTDLPERFFMSEIIREKIFHNYRKEIPYSCEVSIEAFREEENIIRISALILVERQSQKGILIGHKGEALKKTGTQARIDMEKFLGKKVFLEMHVKVKEDWRSDEKMLRSFGYDE
jgi:GTP-binding protein Era